MSAAFPMFRWLACALLAVASTATAATGAAPPAPAAARPEATARDPGALAALDRMGTALRALNQFSLVSRASTEVVLDDGQKIELDSTVTYRVKRPNQLFLEIRSDRQLRQLFYDGKAMSLYSPRLKYYAQADGVHATLGDLAAQVADRYGIELPLADMFLWGTDKARTDAIRSALHIGGGTVDGDAVEQYAFQQDQVDWQIWIATATSLPRKLIITSRDDPALPQYRADLRWDTRTPVASTAFHFTPPADASRIALVPVAMSADDQEN
ncbi:DUF2092 domain-containing protein [Stenotrophomonas sp. GZD-301]|uniref:DUF2092 domain-containing protein n=1 Tax=Stenotrophomonas sp. GZD-301 TaxID=3404814 RepID=UPI003BB5CC99